MNHFLVRLTGTRKWILIAAGLAVTIVSMINFFRMSAIASTTETASESIPQPRFHAMASERTPGVESSPQDSTEAVIVVSQDRSQEIGRILKQATTEYDGRNFDQSMMRAQQALRLEPDNIDALQLKIRSRNAWEDTDTSDFKLLEQANAYFGKGQFDGAALLYNRYTNLHPESRQAILTQVLKSYYNLGIIAMRQRRFDVAAEYFNQNLLLTEAHAPSREALTLAQRYLKEPPPDPDFELPSLMR